MKECTAGTTARASPWRRVLDGGCAGCGASLEPEDHVGGIGLEHEFEIGAERGGAVFEAGDFIEIGDAIELGFDDRKSGADSEVEIARGLEEVSTVGEGMTAVGRHGKSGEEEARPLAKLLSECGNLRGAGIAAKKDVGVAGEIFKAEVGERAAKVLRGDLFKLVRLVEDDGGGFGKNAGVGRIAGGKADRRVGKEEMVIDDNEIGLECASAHFGDEAAAIVGAGRSEAGIGAGVEFVPEGGGFGQGGELGAVAGFGDAFPLGDLAVFVDFIEARENGLIPKGKELATAKVVGAALHIADAELTKKSLEKRNIAEEELILEGFGSRGDDDSLAGAESGQKVCEGFADACASFNDEMAALGEGALHGFGHFVLAGAVLEGER